MSKKNQGAHGGYVSNDNYKRALEEADGWDKKPKQNPIDRAAERERNRFVPKIVRDVFGK